MVSMLFHASEIIENKIDNILGNRERNLKFNQIELNRGLGKTTGLLKYLIDHPEKILVINPTADQSMTLYKKYEKMYFEEIKKRPLKGIHPTEMKSYFVGMNRIRESIGLNTVNIIILEDISPLDFLNNNSLESLFGNLSPDGSFLFIYTLKDNLETI